MDSLIPLYSTLDGVILNQRHEEQFGNYYVGVYNHKWFGGILNEYGVLDN